MTDVLNELRNSSKGHWNKAIAEKKCDDFLKQDIFSMPALQEDKNLATGLMRVRLDSRGGAVKRTIIGHRDNYK